MKHRVLSLLLVATVFWLPERVQSQTSKVEFQSGTHIEVQSGADISADTITVNGTYSGSGTFNSGPLPVEMAAMTAQAGVRDVTISWTTASETDNYGFEIERRKVSGFEIQGSGRETLNLEPETKWSRVGFVRGSGTSASPRKYAFDDENLSPGRYAYRIKQIDHAGSFTYSSSVEVEVGLAPKKLTLSDAYPNPFNPSTIIEFTVPEDGKAALRIYNVVGQLVITLYDGEVAAGRIYQASFDASRLATGIYLTRLEYGGKQITKKISLVK